MKARNYKWLLVFFMLWLPLQGATAAVLSVCVQEKSFPSHHEKSTVTIDSHHHDACHKQTADNTTDHLLASLPCNDTACDAYSNTPILSGYTAPVLTNHTSAITSLHSSFISFVPEQPQRPPLTAQS
ncbi:hypothetical protein [Nitrosomonas sp.]|uniref:hypothetical protein n=1 Tax=Nitrosomonas sp. TaxID=42353 RepID=UPI0025F47B74|nr:hypothetical protein [Nitrosomonas sp.]